MVSFKKNYLTSEFGTTVAMLLGLFVIAFYLPDLNGWSLAVTWCVTSYILARGIFKKDRGIYLYDGYKTTEFKILVVGVVVVVTAMALSRMKLIYVIGEIVFMVSVFNLVRGYTKSLKVPDSRTTLIR